MPSHEEELIEAAYDDAVKLHFAAFYQNVTCDVQPMADAVTEHGKQFDLGFAVLRAVRKRAILGVRNLE